MKTVSRELKMYACDHHAAPVNEKAPGNSEAGFRVLRTTMEGGLDSAYREVVERYCQSLWMRIF